MDEMLSFFLTLFIFPFFEDLSYFCAASRNIVSSIYI